MAYYFKLPTIVELTEAQQAALNDHNPIAVAGGPGTGKSVVSLWRHIRNHDTGLKNSLLLTYTITLMKYLASAAEAESKEAANAVSRTYRWLTHEKEEYDEIIIDEAQDVSVDNYEEIRKYAKDISYGADDQQIIYPNTATSEEVLKKLLPDNNLYILDENFRNTFQILKFVSAVFPNKLITQNTFNILAQKGRNGNKPIVSFSKEISKQEKGIIDIIKTFNSDVHNIAVLVPLRRDVEHYCRLIENAGIKCSKYTNYDGVLSVIENIHITTFKSSKGTEFDTVIIPEFHRMHYNIAQLDVVEENDYYVALTRARTNLYLISGVVPDFINGQTFTVENL